MPFPISFEEVSKAEIPSFLLYQPIKNFLTNYTRMTNVEAVDGPGDAGIYGGYFETFVRDAHLIIPLIAFWFVAQLVLAPGFGKLFFGKKYTSLTAAQRDDFDVRFCAALNGIFSVRGAYYYLFVPTDNGGGYTCSMYSTKSVGWYHLSPVIIFAYFSWDCFVSIRHNWGALFIAHAIGSTIGTYVLMFPMGDELSGHYFGVFELSSFFIHSAEMLALMNLYPLVQTVFKGIFALWFVLVRVWYGTIVTATCYVCLLPILFSRTVHSVPAVTAGLIMLLLLQFLQYAWFFEILKTALGFGAKPATTPTAAVSEKKDTKAKATEVRKRSKKEE